MVKLLLLLFGAALILESMGQDEAEVELPHRCQGDRPLNDIYGKILLRKVSKLAQSQCMALGF